MEREKFETALHNRNLYNDDNTINTLADYKWEFNISVIPKMRRNKMKSCFVN